VTGAETPARKTPASHRRLKTQRHFRRVYQQGRRASGQWMTAVACFGPRRPATNAGPRLGVSVSKDHGGAVRRNKLKRLLREAFRLERHQFPPDLDLVLIPRQRVEDFPLEAMRRELVDLVERVQRAPAPDRRRGRR